MTAPNTAVGGSRTGRPIMRLLDVLGKRWSMRILWELRDQRMTFRELRSQCDDVSPSSLNKRLKELRQLNLVDHDENGYGYTSWGRELGNQLEALNNWSVDWGESLDAG